MSFADLRELFANLGFHAEGYRMPLEQVDRPVIAYHQGPDGQPGHFYVVEPVGGQFLAWIPTEPLGLSVFVGRRPFSRRFLQFDIGQFFTLKYPSAPLRTIRPLNRISSPL